MLYVFLEIMDIVMTISAVHCLVGIVGPNMVDLGNQASVRSTIEASTYFEKIKDGYCHNFGL